MAQDMVWLNDAAVPATEARVSVFDMGFLRGIAAFESLRTYDGHPHALHEHLSRLWACTRAFGTAALHDDRTVRRQIQALLAASGHSDLRVNFICTPGLNIDGLFEAAHPNWVIIARGLKAPPEHHYRDGISVISFHGERLLPELKTTNYLSGQQGMQVAKAAGASEAIYVDAQGLVSEGVTSNLLLVRDDCVIEPDNACLAGITKALLRPLAEELGLSWSRQAVPLTELATADEVWITSSIRELVPVVRIDGQTIGSGKPGTWAQRLGPLFHQRCAEQARRDAEAAVE